jgi:hypothetical protein
MTFFDRSIVVPVRSYFSRNANIGYTIDSFALDYQIRFHKGSERFSETLLRASIPPDARMSTIVDEYAILCDEVERGIDPKRSRAFSDLSIQRIQDPHANGTTLFTNTLLKVSRASPSSPGYIVDSKGRGHWPRMVCINNTDIGIFLIPEGEHRDVVEWYNFLGLPKETAPHEPGSNRVRFVFDPDARCVCVALKMYYPRNTPAMGRASDYFADCGLLIDAAIGRDSCVYDSGFRLVGGCLPKVDKVSIPPEIQTLFANRI